MNADTATSVTLCIVAVLPTPELRASAFLARAHPHGGSAVRAILTVTRTAIQLPAPRIPRPVDAVALDRYRAALHRAIDDRKIDVEEACELGELIRSDGLTRAAVEQVHRELLEGHRLDVHSDGIITWQEADALSKIARLVGLPEQVAAEEELGRQDKATRRALAEWRVVGIGLDDDVAEVLDLAADHAATTGTSISARTRLVVVNDADRALPRVRRAEDNGKLVLNPADAREHLLAAIRATTPAPPTPDPAHRREPTRRVIAELHSALQRVSQAHVFGKGMGIAAPQIGIGRAAAVVRTPGGEIITLLNPQIIDQSDEQDEQYEGCLSFFDVRGKVPRPLCIQVEHQHVDGSTHLTAFARGIARLVAHEIDHLAGVLYTDRMADTISVIPVEQYRGGGQSWQYA
jgi:peptide deformylase